MRKCSFLLVAVLFFLGSWLAKEYLGAAHTRLNVDIVLRHHGQDSVDDARPLCLQKAHN